jgi:uncharacterized protein (DUF1697 family)
METYISLLRGVNVSWQKRVGMKDLVSLYESFGLKNIRTYVQSGNVVFDAPPRDINELSGMVAARIEQVFKFTAAVLVRTPDEFERIIKDNPFFKEPGMDINRLYVTFLSGRPGKLDIITDKQGAPDRFQIVNSEVYLNCPNGYSRTKFSNDFFERKLGLTATTRNWNTVKALFNMAKSPPQ